MRLPSFHRACGDNTASTSQGTQFPKRMSQPIQVATPPHPYAVGRSRTETSFSTTTHLRSRVAGGAGTATRLLNWSVNWTCVEGSVLRPPVNDVALPEDLWVPEKCMSLELIERHKPSRYLELELVTCTIAFKSGMPYVQGGKTMGYALHDEAVFTTIMTSCRGEPMLLRARSSYGPRSSMSVLLTTKRTVLLVNAVVNSGRSLVEFVELMRGFDEAVDIAFVAGVIQSGVSGSIARYVD